MKLQLKILTLNGRSTDKKNDKLFVFLRFFLTLISSLTRKFRSFSSDNQLRKRSNLEKNIYRSLNELEN